MNATLSYRSTFKIVQLNAENLFLYLNQPKPYDWEQMSEKEWQSLSNASVRNKPLVHTLRLASTLLELDADLICINEVGGLESIQNFASLFLKDLYVPHLIEGNSDRGIDVGYLIKADLPLRAELRTHKDRPLGFLYPHELDPDSEIEISGRCRSHYFSRDCAELRLFPKDTSHLSLVVLCVHLKSKLDPNGIDPNGSLRREAEFNTLVDIYKDLQKEIGKDMPIAVVGDFNGVLAQKARDHEFTRLNETDLVSALDVAEIEGEPAATQLVFNKNGGTQHHQIDYVLCNSALRRHLVKENVKVWHYRNELGVPAIPKTMEQRVLLPSDHFPVIAEFSQFAWPL